MNCKLGYNINWDRNRLDRPCHVCGEADCEESLRFKGWDDDEEEDCEIEITSEEWDGVFKRPPRESGISGKLYRIFSEISRECKRQDEKWGEQNHPMTRSIEAPGLFRILADKKKYENQTNDSEGNAMWANILLEEVYEAFAETEPEKQREEMIQTAAVAVQIIECLNRRMEAGK